MKITNFGKLTEEQRERIKTLGAAYDAMGEKIEALKAASNSNPAQMRALHFAIGYLESSYMWIVRAVQNE